MKKYALAVDNGRISAHFGRCPEYIFIELEDDQVITQNKYPNPGHARGAIPKFIHDKGADYIVCGGMGYRAQDFFKQYGIIPILGILGNVQDIIEKIKRGNLEGGTSTCVPRKGRDYGMPRIDKD